MTLITVAYLVAVVAAVLALLLAVGLMRAANHDLFGVEPEPDAHEDALRARLYWQQERAGRIRSFAEPASKGWHRGDAA